MSKFKDNIPGFPGYHVTKNGDVYSMKCKSGKRPEAFKLKPRLNGNGYYRIGLYKDGMKVKDICDKYSIGHTTLNNYLRRFNIPRHT